jgi:hypothetical protein
VVIRVPEPSDAVPIHYPGHGAKRRLEQLIAAIAKTTKDEATKDLIRQAGLWPESLEVCPCGRIGIPCDYCHDPRNIRYCPPSMTPDEAREWDQMWRLCWETEEIEDED